MATKKIYYTVGTANKFSAFEEDYSDGEKTLASKSATNGLPVQDAVTRPPKGEHKKPLKIQAKGENIPLDSSIGFAKVESPTELLDEGQARDLRAVDNKKHHLKPKSRNQRKLDRKSGTGRGKEMKKRGEGGHNWGGDVNPYAGHGTVYAKNTGKTREETDDRVHKGSGSENEEMIDFLSYKEQLSSKRSKLPSFLTETTQTKISTDDDLQKNGYVKYVKEQPRTSDEHAPQGKENSKKSESLSRRMNAMSLIAGSSTSFRERKAMISKRNSKKPPTKNGHFKQKDAPDLEDNELFPSLG